MQPADESESEVKVEEKTDEEVDDDNGNSEEEEEVNPDDETINTEALCLFDELPPKPCVDKEGKPREVLRMRGDVLLEIRVQLATVLGNWWMALARTGDFNRALVDIHGALKFNAAGFKAGNEKARRGLASNYESNGRYYMMLDEPLPERAKEFYIEAIKVHLGEGEYARVNGKPLHNPDVPTTEKDLLSGLDAVVDAGGKEAKNRVLIGQGRGAFWLGPKIAEALPKWLAKVRAKERGAAKTLRHQVAGLVKRIADACAMQASIEAELWLSRWLVLAWSAPDASDKDKDAIYAVETELMEIRQSGIEPKRSKSEE